MLVDETARGRREGSMIRNLFLRSLFPYRFHRTNTHFIHHRQGMILGGREFPSNPPIGEKIEDEKRARSDPNRANLSSHLESKGKKGERIGFTFERIFLDSSISKHSAFPSKDYFRRFSLPVLYYRPKGVSVPSLRFLPRNKGKGKKAEEAANKPSNRKLTLRTAKKGERKRK